MFASNKNGSKKQNLLQVIGLGAAGLALLSGCSVSANLTASADSVAAVAEDALEETVGMRPQIDCGNESIDLVEGNTVLCVLTDPSSGSEYDTTVTITEVSGSSYSVGVEVADTAN